MEQATIIGIDLAKRSSQVHGVRSHAPDHPPTTSTSRTANRGRQAASQLLRSAPLRSGPFGVTAAAGRAGSP